MPRREGVFVVRRTVEEDDFPGCFMFMTSGNVQKLSDRSCGSSCSFWPCNFSTPLPEEERI